MYSFTFYSVMTANQYQEALDAAIAERDLLVIKRADMDARISQLEITIDGLSALVDPTDHSQGLAQATLDASAGITDAIRTVLQQSRTAMTAPQIRDALSDLGYDTTRYSSILTVIHNTIKRMNDQGEILVVNNNRRFAGWRYRVPQMDATDYPAVNTAFQRFKEAQDKRVARNIRTPLNTAIELHTPPTGEKK